MKRPSRGGETRRRKTAAPKRRTAPIVVRRRSSSRAAQEAEIAQLTSLRDEALAQLRKMEISLHSAQSLLSKLSGHLAADLFAAGTSVRLAQTRCCSRLATLATAATALRMGFSRSQWFRVPATSVSSPSLARAGSSVSFDDRRAAAFRIGGRCA